MISNLKSGRTNNAWGKKALHILVRFLFVGHSASLLHPAVRCVKGRSAGQQQLWLRPGQTCSCAVESSGN